MIGGVCGAGLGGAEAGVDDTGPHPVSADGEVIHFTSRPGATGVRCDEDAFPKRVFKRTGGATTVEVSRSQCSRVAPPCAASDGDDRFQAASVDGSVTFLTTARQLTDSDLDASLDLYVHDSSPPAGQPELVQVSAGEVTDSHPTVGSGADVRGVVRAAADGSRVYFVAAGELTSGPNQRGEVAADGADNLFVYERDAAQPGGRLAFVTRLAPGDSDLWSPSSYSRRAHVLPAEATDAQGADADAGGDGRFLIMLSEAALTGDDADSQADLYRYDDATGELTRVSGQGSQGNGDFPVTIPFSKPSRPDYAQASRIATEDAATIVFTTAEPLLPADGNAVVDAYRWRDGDLALVSGPTGQAGVGAGRAMVAANGATILFQTDAQLVATDGDSAADVYAARVDGGFAGPPPPPPPCEVLIGACQGRLAVPQSPPAAGSQSFVGPGNQGTGESRRCDRLKRRHDQARHEAKKVKRQATVLRQEAKKLKHEAKKAPGNRADRLEQRWKHKRKRARKKHHKAQKKHEQAKRLKRKARRCERDGRRSAASRET